MLFKFLKGAALAGLIGVFTVSAVFSAPKNIDLSFSGLIEVDASYKNVENAQNTSNIEVSNASLSAVAKLSDEFTGTFVLWYEDAADPQLYVDEAKIEWKKNDKLSFTLGKFYIISTVSTDFITDAMAVNYIELWKSAAMASYKVTDCVTLKGAIYNGKVQKNSKDDDHIRDFVIAAECANENYGLNVAYISNGAEALEANEVVAADSYSKTGATVVISGTAKVDKFRFTAETAMPASKPVATLTAPGKIGFSVYNLVAGYQFTDKIGADVRYEQSKDKLNGAVQQKNTNIIAQLTYSYNENVTIKAEYLNKEEKAAATKTETDQLTARISYTF